MSAPPIRTDQQVKSAPAMSSLEAPAVGAIELLDGAEIVLLSVKPSFWSVFTLSSRWLLAVALAAVGIAFFSPPQSEWTWVLLQLAIGVGCVRLMFASLQWASRLYILTNRRVMLFQGVPNIDRRDCLLMHLRSTEMVIDWTQRWLRLGTIHMIDHNGRTLTWRDVARPQEVYALLTQTLNRARHADGV